MTSHDESVTEIQDGAALQAAARVGTTVGKKWRLDALLGAGGMAAVYAATHRNGNRAALKILHAALAADRTIRSRFLREGYAANAVGHDGAVRVLDDDVLEDGSPFLVTELLDGETLEDRRERLGGRLSVAEVLTYTDQLLDVLISAHARGVVHRDLKPDNLFLTRAGRLKVLDFGIARLRDLASDSQFTKNGALLGTPRFMAPEQARGNTDEIDGQSDLWACGATMFDLLSGRCVFDAPTPHQILMLAATIPAPPFESVWPEAPPSVASLIDRALAFEKKSRWPNAAAMQQAVRAAYADRHVAPIAPPRSGPLRRGGSAYRSAAPDRDLARPDARPARRAGEPSSRSGGQEALFAARGPAGKAIPAPRVFGPERIPELGAAAHGPSSKRRSAGVSGVPDCRVVGSDAISDQTLTPTDPASHERSTDRPVAASVSAPPARRVLIAIPAFVLGAATAAGVALVVRPGRLSVSRVDSPPVAAAPQVAGPPVAVAPAVAAAPQVAGPPVAAPPAVARARPSDGARPAQPQGAAEAVQAQNIRARPGWPAAPAGGAHDVPSNARASAPAAGQVVAPAAAPEDGALKHHCMRLDDSAVDGGAASRTVCL